MKYYTIPPPPRLAPYVRFFWVYEGEATDAQPFIYRGYADGCTELVFHYRSPFDLVTADDDRESSHAAGIHAQSRSFSRWIVDRDWAIFGCYLYPYAIPRLFGFPATDLTDRIIDFGSVIGAEGSELEERMLTAIDDAERVSLLTLFLESRLDRDSRDLPPVFAAINRIIESRGVVDVRGLSKDYGLSHRQFDAGSRSAPVFRQSYIRALSALVPHLNIMAPAVRSPISHTNAVTTTNPILSAILKNSPGTIQRRIFPARPRAANIWTPEECRIFPIPKKKICSRILSMQFSYNRTLAI